MKKLAKISTGVSGALAGVLVSASSVYAQADDAVGAGMGAFMCVCYALAFIVSIGLLIFTIMMIMDVSKRDEKVLPNKTMWLVLMIVGWVIGGFGWIVALVYYFTRKKKMDAMGK